MTTQHDQDNVTVGDTWEFQITCTDDAGAPLDLTGASFVWEFIDDQTGIVQLTKNAPPAVQATNPQTAGIVQVTVTPVDTQAIPAGFYRDRLTVTISDGEVATLTRGPIAVFS